MKYARFSSSLAIVAVALTALATTASATTITSGGGSPSTPNITLTSEGHVVLHNPIAKIMCASSVTGAIESHGEGVTASGKLSAVSFNNCTNSWHVTVVSNGSLEFHSIGEGDGTITSTGMKIDATRFGVTCVYETNQTDIGMLTDSGTIYKEGPFEIFFAATVHLTGSIPLNFSESGFLCGVSNAAWTGSYGVTNTPLKVDP